MLKKDKEREKAASLIRDEAKKISSFFLRLSHAANPKVCRVSSFLPANFMLCLWRVQYTQVVEEMAGLLDANQEYLALDIAVSSLGQREVSRIPGWSEGLLRVWGGGGCTQYCEIILLPRKITVKDYYCVQ